MGERAGYRCKEGNQVSWIVRRQWYKGGTKKDLEGLVQEVVEQLSDALRWDLRLGRLFSALVKAVATSCFESLEPSILCDIDEHGLFELEMLEWNLWQLNHYTVCQSSNTAKLGRKKILGEVKFEASETKQRFGQVRTGGISFNWSSEFKEF